MKIGSVSLLAFGLLTLAAGTARAGDYTLTIKDHLFTPATLEIPADTKVKITVINQDPTAEEFESESLNREKIIQGNSQGIVFIGPLAPGEYPFVGEFHEETAKGTIVVK